VQDSFIALSIHVVHTDKIRDEANGETSNEMP